jgi:hypothetical protein
MDQKEQQSNKGYFDVISAISDNLSTISAPIVGPVKAGQPSINERNTSTIFTENDTWKIKVVLDNKTTEPFPVPANHIEKVVIEHQISSFTGIKGHLIIRSKKLGNILALDKEQSPVTTKKNEFVFRGDGLDEITFEANPSYDKTILPEDVWFMKNSFIVYEVIDIPTPQGHLKKILFYYKPFHRLFHFRSSFSTANYSSAGFEENLYQGTLMKSSNEERKMYTGDIIKTLLKQAGLKEFIDDGEWERGITKIFYSSGNKTVYKDVIDYVIKYHVAKDGYNCILYFNRGINKFQLISLKQFFDRAGVDSPGPYQLEHYWIQPISTGSSEKIIETPKAPINNDALNFKNDIKVRSKNIISESNYTLQDMSGSTNAKFVNTIMAHSYRHSNKRFSTKIKGNDIVNIKKEFKENFSDQLFPGKYGDALFPINESKVKNYSYQSTYNVLDNIDENCLGNFGKNHIISNNIFLNLSIDFQVPGSTHRHIGRFIAIEKYGDVETKYDDRLLGQWFVIGMVFVFNKGRLYNKITAVKINTQQSLKFREDV